MGKKAHRLRSTVTPGSDNGPIELCAAPATSGELHSSSPGAREALSGFSRPAAGETLLRRKFARGLLSDAARTQIDVSMQARAAKWYTAPGV